MEKFTYVAMPARVVFGAGSVSQLAAEVERLGAKRALLISTPGRAEMVRSVAKGLSVAGLFDKAVMHTPIATVEAARAMAKSVDADCCVTVGGGSTIGFGKAIALTSSLPVVAVPTTYSGSEMTNIWGISEGGAKKTGRDVKVLPKAVIYDPSLTLDLPPKTSAASGMNAMAKSVDADCCVTVGGGSTIGFGKAIALTSSLPVVAVPTTYSGSEMTNIWGISEGGAKKTGRDVKVLPKTVIYDPSLTLDLPPKTSAASGMNAMAHCAEALYAHDGNPIVSLIAEEGIRALAKALPAVVHAPNDLEARTSALYGAWLAGMTIATTGNGLHHKLCHVLGGFGLPHAETHSIVLPHALRYNSVAAEAMRRIARAMGVADAPTGIWELGKRMGLAMRLADVGMKEADIERAAKVAVQAPYPNPRPVEYAPVLELLHNAYEGKKP